MTKNTKLSNEELKTHIKDCPGCGLQKQIRENQTYCEDCFKAIHYGNIHNALINYTFEDIVESFDEDDATNRHFYLVVDFLFLRTNLIKGINKFIKKENLTIIVNKIDVIPKSIPIQKINKWVSNILKKEKIEVRNTLYLSAMKNHGIDLINQDILNRNKNVGFIGYSNVGKSTIITKLAKVNGLKTFNMISHTIGTTKGKIEFQMDNGISVMDFPGLLNHSSNQNYLSPFQLKRVMPKNEIRVKNYTVQDQRFLMIDNYFFFYIKTHEKGSFQTWFSNALKIDNRNYPSFKENLEQKDGTIFDNVIINKEFKSYDAKLHKKILIINGIGFFVLPSNWERIEIYSFDRELHFYLEDSFLKE